MNVDPAIPNPSDLEGAWDDGLSLKPVPAWWSSVSRRQSDGRHALDCAEQPWRLHDAVISDPLRQEAPGPERASFLEDEARGEQDAPLA